MDVSAVPTSERLDFDAPYGMLIDGEIVPAAATLEVLNPATNKPFADAPSGSEEDMNRAIAAAKRAFPSWAALSAAERRPTGQLTRPKCEDVKLDL